MSLTVRPFRGKPSVGMKCQRIRSSDSKGNTACWRCSGVRLSTKAVAASAIAADERSAAMIAPAPAAKTHATDNARRGERTS